MNNWTELDLRGDTPQLRDYPQSVQDIVHVAREIPWDGELPDGPFSIYRDWNLSNEQIRQALEFYLQNPSQVEIKHVDGDVEKIRRILHRLDAD